MVLTELLLDFANSIFANLATDVLKNKIKTKKEIEEVSQNVPSSYEITPRTFPVNILETQFALSNNDLFVALFDQLQEPNIYIFIETEASTFYNLGVVVLEDNRTKDWYIFGRPVAFQGTGGGWGNTKSLYYIIKRKDNAVLSIRIAKNKDIEKLQKGLIGWAEFKEFTIPALACQDEFLKQFQKRFQEEIIAKE